MAITSATARAAAVQAAAPRTGPSSEVTPL